jgi:hypothetical protein
MHGLAATRRRSDSSMMSSWTSVAVWMNSSTAACSTARSSVQPAHPRRHQAARRTDAFAAAILDVLANSRDDGDL